MSTRAIAFSEAEATTRRSSAGRIWRPEPLPEGVLTLASRVYRAKTPMFAARFAGTWVGAFAGFTWLGISDLERAWTDEAIQKALGNRRSTEDTSPLVAHPPGRMSLFGFDVVEENGIYLVRPAGQGEPELWQYFGWDDQRYDSLRAYLEEHESLLGGFAGGAVD